MSSLHSGYSRVLRTTFNLSNHMGIVWLIFAFIAFASVVTFVNPLFESTDEIRHYRFIRIIVTENRLPIQGEEILRAQSHHPPVYYLMGALASAWIPSSHTGEFDHPRNPHWGYRNWEIGVDNKLQYWHPADEFLNIENLAVYIPRLVNVYLGALTIGLTYAVANKIWRDRAPLALAVAALVAFNPQFIYLSAAINNDILAAMTGTLVIYMCIVVVQNGCDRSSTVGLGLALGVAVLSKIHLTVLAPVVAVSLGIAEWMHGSNSHRSNLVNYVYAFIKVFLVTGVVSGWWFIRNILLYGDITGMSQLNVMWGGRSALGSFWALRQGLPYLWGSLWGRFGYGQIPLPSFLYQVLALISSVGFVSSIRVRMTGLQPVVMVVLGLSLLLFLGIVSYYILIQPAGAMGRFLFPVFPVFAIFVIAGWSNIVRNVRWLLGLSIILLVGLDFLAFVVYLYPAVSYPPSPRVSDSHPSYQLGDVVQVSDFSLSSQTLLPGDALFVEVTWYPLRKTNLPVTVYVHMIDEVGAVLAQRDTYPGLGRAPTTSWKVGRVFVDRYRIDVPESVYSPNSTQIKVGMYTAEERLELIDITNDRVMPEGLLVGEVQIEEGQGSLPNPLNVNFGGQFNLIGYEIKPRLLQAGDSLKLSLYWETTDEFDADYSIFAQILDNDWQVWGSKDGGQTDWHRGAVITDVREITLLPDTPSGTYPLQVGLFNHNGRLPILDDNGLHLDDRYFLGPIRVE